MTFGDFANARIAERRATELAIEARQATALADAQARSCTNDPGGSFGTPPTQKGTAIGKHRSATLAEHGLVVTGANPRGPIIAVQKTEPNPIPICNFRRYE